MGRFDELFAETNQPKVASLGGAQSKPVNRFAEYFPGPERKQATETPAPAKTTDLADLGRLGLQGIAGVGGTVGYGLEKTGLAPQLGRTLQASDEAQQQRLGEHLSPVMQEAQAQPFVNPDYPFDSAHGKQPDTPGGTSWINPEFGLRSLAANVVPSIPGSVAMGIAGGPLAKAATLGLKAAGVGAKVAGYVGSGLGFGASEGVFSGAQNAEQWGQQQRAKGVPEDVISQGQNDIFKDTALKTGGLSFFTGGGAYGLIRQGLNKPAEELGKKAFFKATAKGMGTEAVQEAPQSYYEQRTTNQATKDYVDPNQDVNEGALNAGLVGGLAGGLIGGAGGLGHINLGPLARAATTIPPDLTTATAAKAEADSVAQAETERVANEDALAKQAVDADKKIIAEAKAKELAAKAAEITKIQGANDVLINEPPDAANQAASGAISQEQASGPAGDITDPVATQNEVLNNAAPNLSGAGTTGLGAIRRTDSDGQTLDGAGTQTPPGKLPTLPEGNDADAAQSDLGKASLGGEAGRRGQIPGIDDEPFTPTHELPRSVNTNEKKRLYDAEDHIKKAHTALPYTQQSIGDFPSLEHALSTLNGLNDWVKNADGRLLKVGAAANGVTTKDLLQGWSEAAQLSNTVDRWQQDYPEEWANYESNQKQVAALKAGDTVLFPNFGARGNDPTHAEGVIVKKNPKNWVIRSSKGVDITLQPNTLRAVSNEPTKTIAADSSAQPETPGDLHSSASGVTQTGPSEETQALVGETDTSAGLKQPWQQTKDEYLADAEKEIGNKSDFDIMKYHLIDEHYAAIEASVKAGNKIPKAVIDSHDTGKQYHFAKHYGENAIEKDAAKEAELAKQREEYSAKILKGLKEQEDEQKAVKNAKGAVALKTNNDEIEQAQYDVNLGRSISPRVSDQEKDKSVRERQLRLDTAVKQRNKLLADYPDLQKHYAQTPTKPATPPVEPQAKSRQTATATGTPVPDTDVQTAVSAEVSAAATGTALPAESGVSGIVNKRTGQHEQTQTEYIGNTRGNPFATEQEANLYINKTPGLTRNTHTIVGDVGKIWIRKKTPFEMTGNRQEPALEQTQNQAKQAQPGTDQQNLTVGSTWNGWNDATHQPVTKKIEKIVGGRAFISSNGSKTRDTVLLAELNDMRLTDEANFSAKKTLTTKADRPVLSSSAPLDSARGKSLTGTGVEVEGSTQVVDDNKQKIAALKAQAKALSKEASDYNQSTHGRAVKNMGSNNFHETNAGYTGPRTYRAPTLENSESAHYRELRDRVRKILSEAKALQSTVPVKPVNRKLKLQIKKLATNNGIGAIKSGGNTTVREITNIPKPILDALGWEGVYFKPGMPQEVYAKIPGTGDNLKNKYEANAYQHLFDGDASDVIAYINKELDKLNSGESSTHTLSTEHAGYKIYQTAIKGKDYFAVQSQGNKDKSSENKDWKGVFGDTLHDTLEQAQKQAEQNANQATWNSERKQAIAAEHKKEQDIKAERDNIDGFGDNLNPMQKGKAIATLNKEVRIEGIVTTLKEHVRDLVAKGEKTSSHEEDAVKPMTRVQSNRADQREQDAHEKRVKEGGKKTVYQIGGWELGKVAYDYANHLTAKANTQATHEVSLDNTDNPYLLKQKGAKVVIRKVGRMDRDGHMIGKTGIIKKFEKTGKGNFVHLDLDEGGEWIAGIDNIEVVSAVHKNEKRDTQATEPVVEAAKSELQLNKEPYHPAIKSLADDLTKGGGVAYTYDANGKITGRTPSTNPEWFKDGAFVVLNTKGNPDKISVGEIKVAVTRHKLKLKLTGKQQRILRALSEVAEAEEEAGKNQHPDSYNFEQTLLDNATEKKLATGDLTLADIDAAIDEYDDTVGMGKELSGQELNDFWGLDHADETTGSGRTEGDQEETFLTGYSETELTAKAKANQQRERDAAKAELKAKQKAQADQEIDTLADEMLGNIGTNDVFGMANPLEDLSRAKPKDINKAKPTGPARQEALPAAPKKAATEKQLKAAARLRAVAQTALDKASEEQNRERNTNTSKRAREAGQSIEQALKDEALAKTALNIADALESGNAVALAGLSSKAQVEQLNSMLNDAMYARDNQRSSYADRHKYKGRKPEEADTLFAKYPEATIHEDHIAGVRLKLREIRGGKALADGLTRYLSREQYDKITKLVGGDKAKDLLGWYPIEQFKAQTRLKLMGITGQEDLENALREFITFKEGQQTEDKIKAAERALVGQNHGTDFFPTPKSLAQRMSELAGVKPGMRVLEPSAGNGNLADAAKADGATVDVIEISSALRNVLEAKGHPVVAHDFTSYTPAEQYDAVIMNPPFSKGQDAEHIKQAFTLLKPGGKLVAIAGEHAFFANDKTSVAFRAWLDEVGADIEKLPAGTFQDKTLINTTGVNARLISITKATDQGTALYSKASHQQPGLTVAEVLAMKPMHARGIRAMLRAEKLKVLESIASLPEGVLERGEMLVDGRWQAATDDLTADAEALYDGAMGADSVYLFANNITKATLPKLLVHETIHRSENIDPKVKAAINRFESDLQNRFNLNARGIGTPEELNAYRRVIAADTPLQDQQAEYRAYLGEQFAADPESLTGKVKKIFQELIAALRMYLVRHGLDFGLVNHLTSADLWAISKYGQAVQPKAKLANYRSRTQAMQKGSGNLLASEKSPKSPIYDPDLKLTPIQLVDDPKMPDVENVKAMSKYLLDNYRDLSVTNKHTRETMTMNKLGLLSSLKNRKAIARRLYAILPELLENAAFVKFEENTKKETKQHIAGYETYLTPVIIDGEIHTARIMVDLVNNKSRGRGYYYHQVEDVTLDDTVINPSVPPGATVSGELPGQARRFQGGHPDDAILIQPPNTALDKSNAEITLGELVGNVKDKILFSFAGKNAQTADLHQLNTAMERLDAGEDKETVRQETGWSKGAADKKWRFEIDDSEAELKPFNPGTQEVTLGQVLKHDALFAAYPDLQYLPFQYKAGANFKARGTLTRNDQGVPMIAINDGLADAQKLSSILHESQHALQAHENFPVGGSPNNIKGSDFSESYQQQLKDLLDKAEQAQAQGNTALANSLHTQRAQLYSPAQHEAYKRLAGEVEARNVQARQGMSAADRKYVAPEVTQDVADKDVIVVWGGKEMANTPRPDNAKTNLSESTQWSDSNVSESSQGSGNAEQLSNALGKLNGITLTLEDYSDNEVELVNLEALVQNQGAGTKAMRDLIKSADNKGVDLMLIPAGEGERLNRLVAFYKRFGFKIDTDGDVMRRPAQTPANNNILFSMRSDLTDAIGNAKDFATGNDRNVNSLSDIDKILATGKMPQDQTDMQAVLDKAATLLIDSSRPFDAWTRKLPDSQQASELIYAKDRAKRRTSIFEKEVLDKFLHPLAKLLGAIAKEHNLDYRAAKELAGQYLTVKYALEKNQDYIRQDKQAVMTAQTALDDKAAEDIKGLATGKLDAQPDNAQLKAALTRAKTKQQKRLDAINEQRRIDPTEEQHQAGLAGGYNDFTAQYYKDAIAVKIPVAKLDEAAKPIYNMLAWKLEKDLENGKVTQAIVDKWFNSPNYVPLTGDPSIDESDDPLFTHGSINQQSDKRALGRAGSIAQNGIDAATEQTQKSARYHGWVDFKDKFTETYDDLLKTELANGLTEKQAQRAVADTYGIDRSPETGINRPSDTGLIIRKDGKSWVYDINNTEAMDALRSVNKEDTPSLLQPIAFFTRIYARLVTQFMPGFAQINMVRDTWERTENIRTRALPGYETIDMNAVARSAIKTAANPKLIRKLMGVMFEGTRLESKFTVNEADPEVQLIREMIGEGGTSTVGDYLSNTSAELSKQMRDSLKLSAEVMQGINAWNNSFEVVSSFSIYKALREAGVDKKIAASGTLNLMNFSKQGTITGPLKALYTFVNPTLQGGHQMILTLSTKKGQARATAYFIAGVMLYAMLRAGDDDDETGANKTDELGNFVLERNIPIPLGNGTYFKVPMGFGMPQMMWSTAVNVDKFLFGKQTAVDTGAEILKSWTRTLAPIQPSESLISKHPLIYLMQTATPQLFKPLANVAMDVTTFGAPLTSAFTKEDKAHSLQGRHTTPEFYKDIAKTLATTFGIDMYPEQVKEMLRGYAVGPMNEILKATVENPNKELLGRSSVSPAFDRYIAKQDGDALQERLFYRYMEQANEAAVQKSLGEELSPREEKLANLSAMIKKLQGRANGKLAAATKAEKRGAKNSFFRKQAEVIRGRAMQRTFEVMKELD